MSWYEYLVIDGEIPFIEDASIDLGLNRTEFVSGSIIKLFSYQLTRPSDATFDLWRALNPLLYETMPVLIVEKRFTAEIVS